MPVTLKRPPVARAAIVKRSFSHSAPVLWNSLPSALRQPALPEAGSTLAISRSHFLAPLKMQLFLKSYPPQTSIEYTSSLQWISTLTAIILWSWIWTVLLVAVSEKS